MATDETNLEREDKATALAYARGRREQEVDSRLDSHEARLNAINGSIKRNAEAQEDMNRELRNITIKIERGDAIAGALRKAAVSRRDLWLAAAAIIAVLLAAFIPGIHL